MRSRSSPSKMSVHEVLPAGEIVRDIVDEAERVIRERFWVAEAERRR